MQKPDATGKDTQTIDKILFKLNVWLREKKVGRSGVQVIYLCLKGEHFGMNLGLQQHLQPLLNRG